MTRKALTLITLASIFILSGCIRYERFVENNTFYSTGNPKIQIKLSESFEYQRSEEEASIGRYTDGDMITGPSLDKKKFLFKNNKDESAAVIEIVEMENGFVLAYMNSFETFNIDNTLSQGRLSEDSDLYFYISPILYQNKDGKTECLISKFMGKTVGEKARLEVTYLEGLTNVLNGKYHCRDWLDIESFREDQSAFLDQFDNRAKEGINFIE